VTHLPIHVKFCQYTLTADVLGSRSHRGNDCRCSLVPNNYGVGDCNLCMAEDRLEDLWFELSYDELNEELGVSKSTIYRWKQELDLPKKTQWNRVEHEHGVSMERVLYHLHHTAKMSTPLMADALDISRATLADWFHEVDVHKRSRSEAEKLKNEQMTQEERRKQTEKAREKLPDGGGL
jgi:transposase